MFVLKVALGTIAPGSLAPKANHDAIKVEMEKLERFLSIHDGALVTNSINKIPGLKSADRTALKVTMGGELNIHDGTAVLTSRHKQIDRAISLAKKGLSKDEKALLSAQSQLCAFVGKVEEQIVKGKTSFTDAFKKKEVDKFIRATLLIAEKGGMDPTIAIENIEMIEKFKEKLPGVSESLAKNSDRISKLKNKSADPNLAPFFAKAHGEGASLMDHAPGKMTPEAAAKALGKGH